MSFGFLLTQEVVGVSCAGTRFLHLQHTYMHVHVHTHTHTHTHTQFLYPLEYTEWHFHGDPALAADHCEYESSPDFQLKRDHREGSQQKIKNRDITKPVNKCLLLDCVCIPSILLEQDSLSLSSLHSENKNINQ